MRGHSRTGYDTSGPYDDDDDDARARGGERNANESARYGTRPAPDADDIVTDDECLRRGKKVCRVDSSRVESSRVGAESERERTYTRESAPPAEFRAKRMDYYSRRR
mmetsp:Transcript_17404/g.50653  ORF Transcript_17404/g.50653 Transcript_17404/m.50653 type:complete len:107 (-) Transcript_17404:270-590(-)